MGRRTPQDRFVAVLRAINDRWQAAYDRGGFNDPVALRLTERHRKLIVERQLRVRARP